MTRQQQALILHPFLSPDSNHVSPAPDYGLRADPTYALTMGSMPASRRIRRTVTKGKGGMSRLSRHMPQTGSVDAGVKLAAGIALEHVFQVDRIDL
jgi:hypothetical protein